VPVADLLARHADAWGRATRSPFLDAVRDGTLPPAAFDTWLVQDAHFLDDLLRFQARLLARAPRPAQAVLAGGCVALVEELDWFTRVAADRGLDLAAPRLPATVAYADLLDRLDGAGVPTALTALWAVERAYLDAWTGALPGAEEYREFVEHWTVPGFAAYVSGLETAADGAGPPDDAAFLRVAEAEAAFWGMTA
jgi:thiaminase/transcriptional activator TenA